jgi:hypothetical protein
MLMTPQKTTTYNLTAKGNGGDITRSVTVDVTPAILASSSPAAPAPSGTPAAVSSEPAAVRAALKRYKEAYESESLDDMRRAWPSISKAQQRALSTVFDQFNAIHLDLNCADQDIHIDASSATANCKETALYTHKGKRQPAQTTSASFKLRKQGSGWILDSVQ